MYIGLIHVVWGQICRVAGLERGCKGVPKEILKKEVA